jgi:hypothetical protein
MEGGVAIFLLLVVVVVAVGLAIALYVTGGAIVTSRIKRDRPPPGKTDPVAENTSAMRTHGPSEQADREHVS